MERGNRNVLVGLIAIVIIVAVFSSFGLPLFAGPTATITLPTPAPRNTVGPEDGEQGGGTRVEVTPQTVQNVIAVMDRLESYSRVITTTLEGASTTTQTWVDGEWTRADMELSDQLTIHTIVGPERLWRWYGQEDRVLSWPADSSSMDVEGQRLPTYEDVLAVDADSITAAGYEKKNGEACVYVEVALPQLGQVERYWISENSGLLWAAETLVGEEAVWTMASGLPETPVPSYASFQLPDGTVLHTVNALQNQHEPQGEEQFPVFLPVVQKEKE